MKQSIKLLLGGAFLLSLPMFLTSCEDILGEWSKPTPVNAIVTPDDDGGGSTEGIAYVKYTVSGTTATPSNETATTYTELKGTLSTSSLTAGTYVVTDDATLTGTLTLAGDVDLIICDGKTLDITGQISGDDGSYTFPYSLNIYGQSGETGTLSLNSSSVEHALECNNLSIHGVKVTAANTETPVGQVFFTESDLNIFGGNVNANSTVGVAIMCNGGNVSVYNATVVATGGYDGIQSLGAINIYSGTVSSTAGATGCAFRGGDIDFRGGTIAATGGSATNAVIEGNNVNIASTVTKLDMTNAGNTGQATDFIKFVTSFTLGGNSLTTTWTGALNTALDAALSYDGTSKALTYQP